MRIVRNAACALALAAGAVFGASRANAETVLDLTNGPFPDSGTINGAIFTTNVQRPTGSGVIDPFVRIQTNNAIEKGYNTSGRPLQFDENSSPTFTHELALADLQATTISGVTYYQFLLDINQNNSGPTDHLLNLNELQIYLGDAPDLHSGFVSGTGFAGHSTLVYNIDAGSDNGILLDYNLNSGSGSGDMYAFIPTALFTGTNKYVYLYSSFGVPNANNDGYEEWAARIGPNTPPAVPIPASVWGGMALMGLIGAAKFRSRRQSA
jgi:hypothetical protein